MLRLCRGDKNLTRLRSDDVIDVQWWELGTKNKEFQQSDDKLFAGASVDVWKMMKQTQLFDG